MCEEKYTDIYNTLKEEDVGILRSTYKILDVVWLDVDHVCSKMYIDSSINEMKTNVVKNMLNYYLNHKDRVIYKQTDYLCNEREKLCICNLHADTLRKMYEGDKYQVNKKYISWIRKEEEHF